MKKFVIYLAIAMLVLTILPTFALAITTEQEICDIATKNEKVKNAKCVIYERNCIVAIQTEKFTNKTEYCNFLKDFESQVKEKFQIDNVKVTRNPKVMSKIDWLETLDETAKNEQIQKLIEHFLNKPTPLPIHPVKPTLDR